MPREGMTRGQDSRACLTFLKVPGRLSCTPTPDTMRWHLLWVAKGVERFIQHRTHAWDFVPLFDLPNRRRMMERLA